jgi:hypothetical protein
LLEIYQKVEITEEAVKDIEDELNEWEIERKNRWE